ncbi:DUF6932 family protein [Virgibacillus salinus]|uniref:Nucleotidyltransferase domain-containing protein n=1 Tax=Virgibacillus salinus TaxID=553311 RepID=A0A1H0XVV4_9BACI|nr:hypothetical protein [Virgibacillus salinus]SDQ06979.1 hypothetical protein SAMN05216231_0242 [Virgibacillus salinus]
MAIPPFDKNGLLPIGVHDCSIEDIERIFSSLPNKDVRNKLFNNLLGYIENIKVAEIPCNHLLVDGSYVTDKEKPSDVDLALITPYDYTPETLTLAHYEVMHRDTVKSKYGFTLFHVFYESASLKEIIEYYQGVKAPRQHLKKGILRVGI